ncbi:hypothetical protein GCM10009634_27410 [Saccharothrix xinjiangensis]
MTTSILARPSASSAPAADDNTVSCQSIPAGAAPHVTLGPTKCALTGGDCPSDISRTATCPGC